MTPYADVIGTGMSSARRISRAILPARSVEGGVHGIRETYRKDNSQTPCRAYALGYLAYN